MNTLALPSPRHVGRHVAHAVLAGFMLITTLMVTAGPAAACSMVPEFRITLEHLQADDFNQPDSAMAAEWADHVEQMGWSRFETSPTILGAYVIETFATLETDGPWTRGSISAVAEIWGERPDYTRATKHDTYNHNEEPMDSCGFNGDGPELGARRFHLVTDQGEANFWSDAAPEAVFAEVFGEAVVAERDVDQEAEMWQELLEKRNIDERNAPIGIPDPDDLDRNPDPSTTTSPDSPAGGGVTRASTGSGSLLAYGILGAGLLLGATAGALAWKNERSA